MSNDTSSMRVWVSPFWRMASWVLVLLFAAWTVIPLIWMTITAFKPHREIARNILAWPKNPTFSNFTRAWELGNFNWLFINSIVYSLLTTIATVLLSLAVGYAFASIKSKWTNFLYTFVSLGLLITVHSTLIPLFLMENAVGLDNTRLGILLPYIAFSLPFAIYLATIFIKDIPDDIFAAAVLDGANHWNIFRHIIIPMCWPISATIGIFTFLNTWNEFVLIFTLTSEKSLQSLPVGINALAGGRHANYGLQFASLVIGTIPMIIFYILFQKQLHRGFAGGAVKG